MSSLGGSTDPANSQNAEAHQQRGLLLAQQGQLDAAISSLQQALRLSPGSVEIGNQLATLQAAHSYQQASSLLRLGKLAEAESLLRRAVQLKGDFAEAHQDLGGVLADQGKLDDAIASYRRAIQLRPDYAVAYVNLSTIYAAQEKFSEAADLCRQAITLRPNFAEAHHNLASLLVKSGSQQEALAHYQKAIELKPDYAEAYANLAVALVQLNRLEDAVEPFRQALARRPQDAKSGCFLAAALMEQNRLAEATEVYQQVMRVQPDSVEAHLGHTMATLLQGRLTEGWSEYEWRLRPEAVRQPTLSQPVWAGEPLAGKTILLRDEQGSGDTLQFIRYAEMLKAQGATVVVQCVPALKRIVSSCPWVDRVIDRGEPLPAFDVHAHLVSLPGIVGTSLETIPNKTPYLFAPDELIAKWKSGLGKVEGFKVGIAWQGSVLHPRDRVRSFPLALFAGIALMPGVQLHSLQLGPGREQIQKFVARPSVVDLGGFLKDFEDTAAIMKNLDLVIACDSSPVHLAGALDVPVWLPLPFAPDWRWLLEREDTPWYPSMRLFRQKTRGDWQGVFSRIEQELAERVG